jgi:hypothetical protein
MPYSKSKEKKLSKKVCWPDLRYGPNGEEKLFYRPEDVPPGWTNKRDQVYIAPSVTELNREELVATLNEFGVVVNPIWGKAHLKKMIDDRSPIR